eukprot:augustus_masked-scaffold_2-processed-gene-4.44-mRNA-1 protein AED:0.04 eAED:0.04 QI:0/-1/0/1/-1/1/1/0/223
MVYYFKTRDDLLIYMGKDKYENELLIKYGWPEDIWFHVDDLSSAHVYLRLPRGPLRKQYIQSGNLDHLSDALTDCCQLVKANSIQGSKQSAVDIVYTAWENLDKRNNMDVGTIGFKDLKKRVIVRNIGRDREVVKRLEKTKTEQLGVNFEELRAKRDREVIRKQKERQKLKHKQEQQRLRELRKKKEEADYGRIMKAENMVSNQEFQATADASAAVEFEEDFM